ncbi:MAG: type VI secretion system ATPase TssH, partial [Desulfovibrionaceae bacterium]|nr:type VI secretion system ATPase TssH [Desulfovibrionaceae bacterium]
MNINKFTQKSQEALAAAQGLAAQRGHQEVDVEHLALALVLQEQGFVGRVLETMNIQPVVVQSALEEALRKRPQVRGGGAELDKIAITQRLAKVLADAEALAGRMRDEYVSVEHLFAAALNEPESTDMGRASRECRLTGEAFMR